MLTSLQAQLELGDCVEASATDYRPIASHCLPPRYVPNLPSEAVAMHHQSLRGMTLPEAKKAFLNLIQSWPLHKATIFDVMQSFTSNWPRVLWLAVDQKGIHLLEHRSRNTLCTYEYSSILSYSPNMNCLMIITGSDKKQSKVILNTAQAFQIANLIREYTEVLNGGSGGTAATGVGGDAANNLPLSPKMQLQHQQQMNGQQTLTRLSNGGKANLTPAQMMLLHQQQQQQQAMVNGGVGVAVGMVSNGAVGGGGMTPGRQTLLRNQNQALVAPQPS